MQIVKTLLVLSAASVSSSLAAEYRVDFRDGNFDNRQLRLIGAGSSGLVKPGPSGLLTSVPAGVDIKEVGFTTKCLIKGDFEITASYEILGLAPPTSGYGVGACIHLVAVSKEEHAATLSRLKRVEEGDVYAAHTAWYADGGKREHLLRLFHTKADFGKLRLVRIGNTLEYSVADEKSEEFRQLRRVAFTDADVELVRVSVNRNGARSAASVLWKDFTIRAAEISDLPRRSSGPGLLFWGICVLAVTGAVLGARYWRRRTSG